MSLIFLIEFSSYEQLLKLALITTVLFRESLSELKLPETPEQDKNIFRIPVGGMPMTSSTSMDDDEDDDDKDQIKDKK